jgi:hypothetical protein
MWRHKEGLKLYRGEEVEVRFAVSQSEHDLLTGERYNLYGYLVNPYGPRNVAFDKEDADSRQWAKCPPMAASTFLELYEPEER